MQSKPLLALVLLCSFVPGAAIRANARPGIRAALPSVAQPDEGSIQKQASAMLNSVVRNNEPGAAILIARGDRVLVRSARGIADLELGVQLSPDQVFRIGSVTKMFTATMILKLADEGRLSLDDSVSKFMPDYPNGGRITVAQLLNHTSGIADSFGPPGPSETRPHLDHETATLISGFKGSPTLFAPGTDFAYSNAGYILLGAIIEHVTGEPWWVAMKHQFFDGLGLRHTDNGAQEPIFPGRVAGYDRDENDHITNAGYDSAGASGALDSSVDDLFRWMRSLNTGKLLSADNYRRMTTPRPSTSGQPDNYGYGMMLGKVAGVPALFHFGEIDGFGAALVYLPQEEVTVVVLTNQSGASVPFHAPALSSKLAALAIGRPYPIPEPVKLTQNELREFVGSYRIGTSEIRRISLEGGVLFSQRNDGPLRRLIPSSGDRLFMAPDCITAITAIRDKTGTIVAIDFADDVTGPGEREPKMLPSRNNK